MVHVLPSSVLPLPFFLYNNVKLIASNRKEYCILNILSENAFYHLMLLAELFEGRHRACFIRWTVGSVDLLGMSFQNFHYKSLFSRIYISTIKISP